MKKLGLVGGTGPESTVIYYQELNKQINAQSAGKAFPEMAIESVNLYKALGLVADKNYDELEKYLSAAIGNLEKGGAKVISLTAVTMHVVFDELQKNTNVPLISIPETTAEYAAAKGYKKVGLLGTIFTMENDYLSKSFVKRGIEVVVPSKEDRVLVNERISKELEYGIVKETSKNELIAVVAKMVQEQGIDAIVLGCTELPLVLNQDNCPVACLDVMDIHIKKLIECISE